MTMNVEIKNADNREAPCSLLIVRSGSPLHILQPGETQQISIWDGNGSISLHEIPLIDLGKK